MNATAVVRPIRDVDAESLGRVHATTWHETYDHLISSATLANLSPRRMAELWTHWAAQGPEYTHFAALVDGEIVGFSGSGPGRDEDMPRERELYFIYLLDAWHGTGIGQQLFDNPRAHRFYERNGFHADGAARTEPFLGETIDEVRLTR
jgi:GNAT superfamily N-acetyltransferase